jgi:glycosyltransferase involved in cell wall biosynthesis
MKKRILFIHTIANTPYKHEYYNALAAEYEVHVIQLSIHSEIRQWPVLENKLYTEYIISYDLIDIRNKFASAWKSIKLIRAIKPLIIVSHGYNRFEYFILPLVFRQIITACDVSSTYQDRKRFWLKERLKSVLLNYLFDYFFTYGLSSKAYLSNNLDIPSYKIFVRGNYSHLQTTKPELPNFKDREKRILYVGRFSEEKNVISLINAFVDFVNTTASDYKLTLVGSGPLKPSLEAFVKTNASGFNIEFIDYKYPSELIPFYLNSRLFVLPSYSETWGQVVNEAMHFGLPIAISKNCGCVQDLCKDNSRLFDPYNYQELTKIFSELLLQEEQLIKMSDLSLTIIDDYSPEKLINRTNAIFEEILADSY